MRKCGCERFMRRFGGALPREIMLRLNADRAGGELFVYKLVAKTVAVSQ